MCPASTTDIVRDVFRGDTNHDGLISLEEVRKRDREREREREREKRKRESVCVCVCERERERERKSARLTRAMQWLALSSTNTTVQGLMDPVTSAGVWRVLFS